MPNITINLTDTQAAFIRRHAADHGHASADAVTREALDLLREKDEAMKKWLREEVLPVCKKHDADPSRAIPIDEVFDELWQHHERSKKAHRLKASARDTAEDARNRIRGGAAGVASAK